MQRRTFILVVFLIFLLILQNIPYVNVVLTNKIWIIYAALLFLLYYPQRIFALLPLLLFSVFAMVLFTVFGFSRPAEITGIAVYLLLWDIVIISIIKLSHKHT